MGKPLDFAQGKQKASRRNRRNAVNNNNQYPRPDVG